MSKKKKPKIIPSQVNINSSNIRQLLLDKLKEHKKTRKIETKITPLQDKTFDEQVRDLNENVRAENSSAENSKAENSKAENSKAENSRIEPIQEKEKEAQPTFKPYGNLKNGTKPTFKQLYPNQTQPHPQIQGQQIQGQQGQVQQGQGQGQDERDPIDERQRKVVEEKEVKKIFKLGKKGKTVSILIKNNKTRKLIEDSKIDRKKKNLSTIKNYLKDKNLIKFGTTAPSKLLREIYETSELCGGVLNENKDVLIHNFDK